MIGTIIWTGVSGTRYEFQLDALGTQYKPKPGVYVFCHAAPGGWIPDYVGETEDFNARLSNGGPSHHQLDSIKAAGATHIATRHEPGGLSTRVSIETDLRHGLNPCCNRQ
jgi:hypothetical protein